MLLELFGRPFGVSVVSLACWCHLVGCIWLAWAVCGLSLLLFGAAFGLCGLSVGSLCYFFGAFGSSRLSVGAGIAPGLFFGSFSKLVPCFFNCSFIC